MKDLIANTNYVVIVTERIITFSIDLRNDRPFRDLIGLRKWMICLVAVAISAVPTVAAGLEGVNNYLTNGKLSKPQTKT